MRLQYALVLFFAILFAVFIASHYYAYTEYRHLFLKNIADRTSSFVSDLEDYELNEIKREQYYSIQNILDKMVATRPIISSLSVSMDGQNINYSSDRALKNSLIPKEYIHPKGSVYEDLNDGKFNFIYDLNYFAGPKMIHGKILVKLNEWRITGEMKETAIRLTATTAAIQLVVLLILAYLFFILGVTPLYKTLHIAESGGGQREYFWIKEINKLHEAILSSFNLLNKQNNQLAQQEEQFRNVFENMSSGAVVYEAVNDGEDFVFKEINSAVERIERLAKIDLIGKRVTTIFPAMKELGFLDVFQRVFKSGNPEHFPLSFYKDDRLAGWRENYIYKLSNGDIAVIYDDLTEKKQAEQAVLELNKSLESRVEEETSMRLKAEQAMYSRSKMVLMGEVMGMVAHHWRQPLNAIGITVQDIPYAFRAGEVDEKYIKELVSSTMGYINTMSKTLDDFRNFFMPNQSRKEFCIEDAIMSALNIATPSLKENQITANLDFAQKHTINGFENEFKQVVINLLSNAKDAIVDNAKDKREINIKTYDNDGFITITMEDTGSGIASEIMDRIFEPYFTTKEQGKGTGIGLYMSKQLVERHIGGTINCSNGVLGAKFEIKLKVSQTQT